MKKYLLLIVPIILTGCTANYTLTYENNNFNEEVIIENINDEELSKFDKLKASDNFKDEKNNLEYKYIDNGKTKTIKLDIGEDLVVTKLLNYCYEDIYLINESNYFTIQTGGEKYCKNYDIKVNFKTDKNIINSNADSINDNVLTWNKLDKDINIQVSKTDSIKKNKNEKKNSESLRYIIVFVLLIVVGIATFFIYKLKNNKE